MQTQSKGTGLLPSCIAICLKQEHIENTLICLFQNIMEGGGQKLGKIFT